MRKAGLRDFRSSSMSVNQTRYNSLFAMSTLIISDILVSNLSLNLVETCICKVEMSIVQLFENDGGGTYCAVGSMCDYCCN